MATQAHTEEERREALRRRLNAGFIEAGEALTVQMDAAEDDGLKDEENTARKAMAVLAALQHTFAQAKDAPWGGLLLDVFEANLQDADKAQAEG